jgi:hypothetical protein
MSTPMPERVGQALRRRSSTATTPWSHLGLRVRARGWSLLAVATCTVGALDDRTAEEVRDLTELASPPLPKPDSQMLVIAEKIVE